MLTILNRSVCIKRLLPRGGGSRILSATRSYTNWINQSSLGKATSDLVRTRSGYSGKFLANSSRLDARLVMFLPYDLARLRRAGLIFLPRMHLDRT